MGKKAKKLQKELDSTTRSLVVLDEENSRLRERIVAISKERDELAARLAVANRQRFWLERELKGRCVSSVWGKGEATYVLLTGGSSA
jgi:uncharacterized protein involved in exopolysaccharide biosynthesis